MPKIYSGPGTYVAVCNQANFDGHYVKVFVVPAEDTSDIPWRRMDPEQLKAVEAGWWFLNRVDYVACLEAVYPLEVFRLLMDGSCYGVDNGESDNPNLKPEVGRSCYDDNDVEDYSENPLPLHDKE